MSTKGREKWEKFKAGYVVDSSYAEEPNTGNAGRDRWNALKKTIDIRSTAPRQTAQDDSSSAKKGFFDRLGLTVSGGAKGSLAGNMDAMGVAYEAGQSGRTKRDTAELKDAQWAVARAKHDYDADPSEVNKSALEIATTKMKAFADVLGEGAYEQALEAAYDAAAQFDTGDLKALYNSLGVVTPKTGTGVQQQAAKAARDLAVRVQDSATEDILEAKDGTSKFWQMAIDAGASATQMALDAASNAVLGTNGSMVPFATRAFGGATMEARQGGADLGKQALYGAAQTAKEVFTEKMFNIALPYAKTYGKGGFDGIVENGIRKAADKLGKSKIGKAALEKVLTFGASAATEGMEELIGDWMEWQLPRIYGGDVATAEETLSDSLYDFVVGFMSGMIGGAMTGPMKAIDSAVQAREAKKAYGAQQLDLVNESEELSPGNEMAKKYRERLDGGKNLSGRQLIRLIQQNETDMLNGDKAKIQAATEKRLTELGESDNVRQLAEIVARQMAGEELSRDEQMQIDGSKYGKRVLNELNPSNIRSGGFASGWAKSIGTNTINHTEYNADLMSLAGDVAGVSTSSPVSASKESAPTAGSLTPATLAHPERFRSSIEFNFDEGIPASPEALARSIAESRRVSPVERMAAGLAAAEKKAMGGLTVSESGKLEHKTTGKEIGKLTIVSDKDKKLKLKTESGEIVDAKDVNFRSKDEAMVYSAVLDMGVSPVVAQSIVDNFDGTDGRVYAADVNLAYQYGKMNFPKRLLERLDIKPHQAEHAYNLGRSDAKAEAVAPKTKRTVKGKRGTVIFETAVDESTMTPIQKASLNGIKAIADLSGLNVHVFESRLTKDGYKFTLPDGTVTGANGWYVTGTNDIWIDMNAGNAGEGTMLYTAAHEISHFIKEWSPTKWRVLADFLLEQYGEDVPLDALLERQMAKVRKNNPDLQGNALMDAAYEELVSDAMSEMLVDGEVVQKLAELKQKDKTLWEKIKDAIRDLLEKWGLIRKEYEGRSVAGEAEFLRGMDEAFKKLQDMYAEAFADADANFSAAEDLSTDTQPVETSVKHSFRSLAEAAGFGAMELEDGTKVFLRDRQRVSRVTLEDIENSPIGAMINFSVDMKDITTNDADRQKKMFRDVCNMAIKTGDFNMTMQFAGSAVFTGMKANADKQYGTTYDFPSICTKTQAVIDAMSARMVKLGRGLISDEIVEIYRKVFASGNPVPCPECYVFSRWIGIGGLLDNIKTYQDTYGKMSVDEAAAAYDKLHKQIEEIAKEKGISFGKAKGKLASDLQKEYNKLKERIEKNQNQGEKVKPADAKRLADLEPMMTTVKALTWLENVYFADEKHTKINKNFRVPDNVLFDLNNGEAFATQYKEAWAFRTTQGAGYGKAITPYAEARLGEGILVTNNTVNAIKGKAKGTLKNYFLDQKGRMDGKAVAALKKARAKQKNQAFIGGQRFQSTSDARYENASDYLLAALEMQAMGGMVQVYTKVDGAVPAFSAWGFSINQSLMPLGGGLDANGNVKDTSTGGMNPDVAFRNREKHETAGTITIGVNDNHIRKMFAQWERDFIIPYHASGGKATIVAEFRDIQEKREAKGAKVRSTDYSRTQSDKVLSDEVLRWMGRTEDEIRQIHAVRDARIAILTGKSPNMDVVRGNRFLSNLYDKLRTKDGEWYGVVLAKGKVEGQIFPNEFWDQSVSYEDSAKITEDYLAYCKDLGILHRFSGMVPQNGILRPVTGYNERGERVQLTDLAYKYKDGEKTAEVEPFFWKVLTDRRMYDNSKKYLPQKRVTLNDTTTDTVATFATGNYGRQYNKELSQETAAKLADAKLSTRDAEATGQYADGVKFSERDIDSVSNRDILANAFMDVAQNDFERGKIAEYQQKIKALDEDERKLRDIRAQLHDLSFSAGPRDNAKIRELREKATKLANRIGIQDKQLLRLEASKPLMAVLERENKLAYSRASQKWEDRIETARTGRSKTEMRHKIKKIVGELNNLLLHGTKDKHIMIGLQKATAEALSAINMDTVAAEKRLAKIQAKIDKATDPAEKARLQQSYARVEAMGDNMATRLTALKNAYEEIKDSGDPLVANAYQPEIEERIKNLRKMVGDTPLRNMSMEQLEFTYDTYKMVLTTIRNANKAFKNERGESIAVLGNRSMEEIGRVGGKKELVASAMRGPLGFAWSGMKPTYAFKAIGSDTLSELFSQVRAGEDVWATDVNEAKEFYSQKTKQYHYDSWDLEKEYTFTSKSGKEFKLTLEQIMSLYAYSKRKQADAHLDKGGFVYDSSIEVVKRSKLGIPVKYRVNTAHAHALSRDTLMEICKTLTDEQVKFVDEMQDYLSTVMGEKGNEVSLKMYGVKLFKEKFYFPLKSAKQFMYEQYEVAGDRKIKNSGFSKDTTPHASNPVILNNFTDVWATHVNDMAMYHAFVLPMEDFERVFNYKTPTSDTMPTESVKGYLQDAYGVHPEQYIKQLMTDLNGGARIDPTAGIINKGIALFKKSAVFASLSVVIQQPSAIARAMAYIDAKYFVGKPGLKDWDEVKKYAPVAIIKEMGYFDTNMGKSTVEFIKAKEYTGVKSKMKALVTDRQYRDEILSKAPSVADELAWCQIWNAVKKEIAETKKLQGEELLQAAGKRFTEVIVNTQVYDSVLTRSGMMRSKDTGMKMATSFMAEPTTSLNMIADALIQGKRGNKSYARKTIGAVAASMILNSILVSFVYAGRDDDEDKTYIEKYAGSLTSELIDSFNPLTLIPFVKDIVSIAQGYDVERSDMAVITDLFNAWKKLSSDNLSVYRKVEGFGGTIASIFGLPLKNIMRDVRGIYNTVKSAVAGPDTTGRGMLDAAKESLPKWMGGGERSNADQLYAAMLSGDTGHVERLKARFKDDRTFTNAVRNGLVNNDKRITAAAEARAAGNQTEYMRLAREIINEGHFSQDDVVRAVNYVLNSLTKKESEPAEATKPDTFKIDEYLSEALSGDQAEAELVKREIIAGHVADGKTEDEALKSFNNSFKNTAVKGAFTDGDITMDVAIAMLQQYGGVEPDDAYADVQYWQFKQNHPDIYVVDSWFDSYYEYASDAGIGIDVYMQYRNDVKNITGENKKERRMAAINALPLSPAQKDALYFDEGWVASKLYEAPWR